MQFKRRISRGTARTPYSEAPRLNTALLINRYSTFVFDHLHSFLFFNTSTYKVSHFAMSSCEKVTPYCVGDALEIFICFAVQKRLTFMEMWLELVDGMTPEVLADFS